MTGREAFLSYMKHGGSQPFCSPQIGAGAGYDAKLAGKRWISEGTLEDTIAATARYEMVPLFIGGLPDPGTWNPALRWREIRREWNEERRESDFELITPYGSLFRSTVEYPCEGVVCTRYPVSGNTELRAFEWVVDAMADGDLSSIAQSVKATVDAIGDRGVYCVQWAMQPYEMLCFLNTLDTMFLAQDEPGFFRKMMDKIIHLSRLFLEQTAKGGADFVFLGGPAKEMVSPDYFEQFLVPGSRAVTSAAHELGLNVYCHVCSPVEPFLSMGYYNQMGIDLFETLSPPPVGNVNSLADAMREIDPAICTRGNVGLDLLLNGTPQQIQEAVYQIKQATSGRKHMIAASDYLFYHIPEENVVALCEAADQSQE